MAEENKHLYKKRNILILIIVAMFIVSTGTTAAFLFMKTPTMLNTFVNGEMPYGTIQISKKVEHPYGESYIIPEDKLFTFDVNLGKDCAGKTFSGCKADENGIISFKIGSGTVKTISRVPAGTKAVVTEKELPEGFSLEGDNNKEVTVVRAETANVDFVNVYKPQKASTEKLYLKGKKVLEGREWEDSDSFSINLEQKVGDGWEKIGKAVASKSSKGFDFTDNLRGVPFDEKKTYSFRISEEVSENGDIVYDSDINYFDVIVDDSDMDGKLEISEVISYSEDMKVVTNEESGETSVNIDFINKYVPKGSKIAHINVKKILTDTTRQKKSAAGYKFGLFDEFGNQVGKERKTSSAGEVSFSIVCSVEDIGTRTFILKEINESEPGVEYDSSKHMIALSVEEPAEDIKVRLYNGKNDAPTEGATDIYNVSFTNLYNPENATLTLTGKKNLIGREIKESEFEFNLFETDSTYKTEGISPIDVQKNNSEGTFKFDFDFEKVGTYYYAICEKINSVPGISYDKTKYMVKVIVTDSGGKLSASADVINGSGKKKEIVFENKYAPGNGSLLLTGIKKLDGKSLRKGQYSFTLCETDSNFENEKDIECVTNDAEGKISFNELSYSKEGTYYYTIKEKTDNPEENVQYDRTVYQIIARVKDNKNGKLAVEKEIYALKDGKKEITDNIVFANMFSADYASLDITAKKTFSGKTLENGMFEFVLYRTGADFDCKGIKAITARNNAEGEIVFSDVRLNKAGTCHFVLREKQKENKGITYDRSEYRITAQVKANERGQLVADIISIEKKGKGNVNSIDFHNSFSSSDMSSKTGDYTKLALWITMLILSAVGIVLIIVRYVRHSKEWL